MDEQTIGEKSAQVPLSVVKGMVLNGTVDDVLEQAAEWRDHGVRYIVWSTGRGPSRAAVISAR